MTDEKEPQDPKLRARIRRNTTFLILVLLVVIAFGAFVVYGLVKFLPYIP